MALKLAAAVQLVAECQHRHENVVFLYSLPSAQAEEEETSHSPPAPWQRNMTAKWPLAVSALQCRSAGWRSLRADGCASTGTMI